MNSVINLLIVVLTFTGCGLVQKNMGGKSDSSNEATVFRPRVEFRPGVVSSVAFAYDPASGQQLVNGNKMYFEMRNGDIIRLPAKTFKKISVPAHDVTIEGKGVDKTIIQWPKDKGYGSDNQIWKSDGVLVFKNMTIENPQFHFVKGGVHLIFVNVKFKGEITASGSISTLTFLLSEFSHKPVPKQNILKLPTHIFNIGPSRLKLANGQYQAIADEKFANTSLSKTYKTWVETDVSDFSSLSFAAKFRKLADSLVAELKKGPKASAQDQKKIDAYVSVIEKSGEDIENLAVLNKDQKKALSSFAASKTFKAEGNYLLESFLLARAKQLAESPISGLDLAVAENRKSLEKEYGCQFDFKLFDITRSEAHDDRGQMWPYKVDHSVGVKALKEIVSQGTPLIAHYSGDNSVCKMTLNLTLTILGV